MSNGPVIGAGASGVVATRPHLLAFSKDDPDLAVLRQVADAHGWGANNVYEGDITSATEFLRTHPSPQVLVIEIPTAGEAPALLDRLADVCAPDVKVVVTGNINEYSFFCWLTDLGVSSYLLKPLTAAALEGAFARATQPAGGGAVKVKASAEVIGVIGTRGGVGATTLSVAMSMIIARKMGKNTVLADLNPQDGSVALAFDLEPVRGLRDALEKPDRIDSLFLDRMITRAGENLAIIGAEESLAEKIHYHAQAAEILIREAREKCDVLVLDLARGLDDFTVQALRQVGQLVVVTDLSLAGLRDTLRLTDALRDHVKIKSPLYVASRVGLSPKHEMIVSEFEKAASIKFTAQLPFAPDQMMGLNGDIPVIAAVDSKPHQALRKLVQAVLPEASFIEEANAPKKSLLSFSRSRKKE